MGVSVSFIGAAIAGLIVLASLAGCTGIPNDGRYQTHDGGRSNFRADAPASASARWLPA